MHTRRATAALTAGVLICATAVPGIAGADPLHAKPPVGTCPNDGFVLVPVIPGTVGVAVDQNNNGEVCYAPLPTGGQALIDSNVIDDVAHNR